jgi:hypothetical protein
MKNENNLRGLILRDATLWVAPQDEGKILGLMVRSGSKTRVSNHEPTGGLA